MHQTKIDIPGSIHGAAIDIAGATRRGREKLMRASTVLITLPLVLVSLAAVHAQEERTGYKVIRILMEDGEPTGVHEDFMTGFVLDDDRVRGRPAGIAVARDGSLLVSDDANGTIFRVAYEGSR